MAAPDGASNRPIDLTGDTDSATESVSTTSIPPASDDGDLNEAIALSLQSMPTSPPPGSVRSSVAERVDTGIENASCDKNMEPIVGGILGMDRKRQEEERLARLKRKRGSSETTPPVAKQDVQADAICQPSVSTRVGKVGRLVDSKQGKAEKRPGVASRSTLQYPSGVVKQTWACGVERTDDIKIEEVLQRSRLEAAVLSSFQWDWDWLLPKMDTQRTKFVFVLQAKEERMKQHYREDFKGVPNVRLCFPPMEGQINCMHSKLMLLFYSTHLRIVIPTANLVPYDWGEPIGHFREGVMENTVFMIDLPGNDSKSTPKKQPQAGSSFFQSLQYFVASIGLPTDVTKKLSFYDFSPLAHHGFIHSIGGAHHGDAWKKTGVCGLGQFLNETGLRTLDSIQVDYVTSSVGSLDDEFLRSLYLVAQGDSGLSEYTLRTGKSIPPGILKDLRRRVGEDFSYAWKQNFRIYFPSNETIRRSKGGAGCAGTICFQSRWWQGPKFPRAVLRDCRSRREGMLMHNKIWYTRYKEPVCMRTGRQALGWAYVGSANLSESAWGRLVQDRITKAPKLSCRNWECGVVLPIITEQDSIDQPQQQRQLQPEPAIDVPIAFYSQHSRDHLAIFKNIVPVPMIVPGQPYPVDNGDEKNNSSRKSGEDDSQVRGGTKMIPWFGV